MQQSPSALNLRTNLLHDLLLTPNLGIEWPLDSCWTLLNCGSFAWWSDNSRHRYWRVAIGEMELRRYFGRKGNHHFGLYAAVYRYDFEFGATGYQAHLNYGAGLNYGYFIRLNRRLGLDLSLGLGYLGGIFKQYEPNRDAYYWTERKRLTYFGPTRLESTLVWRLGHRKGGAR